MEKFNTKGWLVFYHDKLSELGDIDLMNNAHAELPEEVFVVSTNTKRPCKTISPMSEASVAKKSRLDQRKQVNDSIRNKAHEASLYAAHERKISQEKYLTQLEKETFDLELEYEEIHRNGRRLKEQLQECSSSDNRLTELNVLKKRRKLVKKHIVRNRNSIANLKKDLKIEDEDSSSDDSVF